MDRRSLISRFGVLMLGITTFRSVSVANVNETVALADDKDESPHADAIALVLKRQQKEIALAEQAFLKINDTDWSFRAKRSWSYDTIKRSWSVNRVFPPGYFNLSHFFAVDYLINDKVVCSWSVDTRRKTAELAKNKSVEIKPPNK